MAFSAWPKMVNSEQCDSSENKIVNSVIPFWRSQRVGASLARNPWKRSGNTIVNSLETHEKDQGWILLLILSVILFTRGKRWPARECGQDGCVKASDCSEKSQSRSDSTWYTCNNNYTKITQFIFNLKDMAIITREKMRNHITLLSIHSHL